MSRTYVLTGSASGIGAATRTLLESQGARVIGVDLHDAEVTADLATPAGRAALVDDVRAASGGSIDAVIANAGVALMDDPLTVRVNYFGTVATLEGLRPLLLGSDSPRAVVTASMAVLMPTDPAIVEACLAGDEEAAAAAATGNVTVYSSSKRALGRWVRRASVTEEWAGAGIPLNAVGPGVIETPMTIPLMETEEGRTMMREAVPMPLGGFAQPEQVAPLLAWLTSEENSMVTGQVVFIDGGSDAVLRGDDVWADPEPA